MCTGPVRTVTSLAAAGRLQVAARNLGSRLPSCSSEGVAGSDYGPPSELPQFPDLPDREPFPGGPRVFLESHPGSRRRCQPPRTRNEGISPPEAKNAVISPAELPEEEPRSVRDSSQPSQHPRPESGKKGSGHERWNPLCAALVGSGILWALMAPAALGQKFIFNLVAEEEWNGGRPSRDSFLETGQIYLFRTGSYTPEVVAQAGQAQEVPPGTWHWIAESEGYVSVVSGRIDHPEGVAPFQKGLIEPVVPACEIHLGSGDGWAGLRRLDAVSLTRSAVYPIAVEHRRRFRIPVGEFVAYTVGEQGIEAISPVSQCQRGDKILFPRPQPPATGFQDLVIHVEFPPGEASHEVRPTATLLPAADSADAPLLLPTASFFTGSRATFFFLGVSAKASLLLRIEHPQALPHQEQVLPTESRVRELKKVVLLAR